jgi:uncharacterized protein (DUF58 family)
VEFAQAREYQPGDDVRRIDWQLTARSDRPYVRDAYEERGLDIWLVVDVSASMNWGTAQCLKRERAVDVCAVAGDLLAHRGNRVGLVLFADQLLGVVPPGAGRPHVERVLGRLMEERRGFGAGSTDLADAVSVLPRLARRPCMIVLVSDFLAPDGWAQGVRALARRHEVLAVRLVDPRELDLPDIGVVTFEDPETGAQLTVDTASAELRQRFRAAAAQQTASLLTTLRACRVEAVEARTDRDLLSAMAAFLDARRRRKKVAA